MKITSGRYTAILILQTVLILIDFGINTFLVLVRTHNALMLMLFILQDVCLILALATLLLTFFSTYVFQAGLVELLYDRFRSTLTICIIYFIFTTVLHIWSLSVRWREPLKYNWSKGFHLLFITQRLISPIYYYFYKRAALRISDPRFYEDIEWVQNSQMSCGK